MLPACTCKEWSTRGTRPGFHLRAHRCNSMHPRRRLHAPLQLGSAVLQQPRRRRARQQRDAAARAARHHDVAVRKQVPEACRDACLGAQPGGGCMGPHPGAPGRAGAPLLRSLLGPPMLSGSANLKGNRPTRSAVTLNSMTFSLKVYGPARRPEVGAGGRQGLGCGVLSPHAGGAHR